MQNQDNPFKGLGEGKEDLFPGAGTFVPEGRHVAAGHGIAWLGRGWEMFRQAPATWVAISMCFLAIAIVLGVIPGINLIFNLLIPVFAGGIMMGCKAIEQGGELRIGHLFAGFTNHAGDLVVIGLIYLAGIVAMIALMVLVGGGVGFGAAMMGSDKAVSAAGAGVAAMLVAMLFFVPLAMAVWYAPPLVVFHDVRPMQAVKASFLASLKNVLPFTVYALIFVVLAILASLPFFLGWLVLIPVAQASVYAGYKDMFTRD